MQYYRNTHEIWRKIHVFLILNCVCTHSFSPGKAQHTTCMTLAYLLHIHVLHATHITIGVGNGRGGEPWGCLPPQAAGSGGIAPTTRAICCISPGNGSPHEIHELV